MRIITSAGEVDILAGGERAGTEFVCLAVSVYLDAREVGSERLFHLITHRAGQRLTLFWAGEINAECRTGG